MLQTRKCANSSFSKREDDFQTTILALKQSLFTPKSLPELQWSFLQCFLPKKKLLNSKFLLNQSSLFLSQSSFFSIPISLKCFASLSDFFSFSFSSFLWIFPSHKHNFDNPKIQNLQKRSKICKILIIYKRLQWLVFVKSNGLSPFGNLGKQHVMAQKLIQAL